MGVAFYATLVGVITNLWLNANYNMLRTGVRQSDCRYSRIAGYRLASSKDRVFYAATLAIPIGL
jgi:hypothetical protein